MAVENLKHNVHLLFLWFCGMIWNAGCCNYGLKYCPAIVDLREKKHAASFKITEWISHINSESYQKQTMLFPFISSQLSNIFTPNCLCCICFFSQCSAGGLVSAQGSMYPTSRFGDQQPKTPPKNCAVTVKAKETQVGTLLVFENDWHVSFFREVLCWWFDVLTGTLTTGPALRTFVPLFLRTESFSQHIWPHAGLRTLYPWKRVEIESSFPVAALDSVSIVCTIVFHVFKNMSSIRIGPRPVPAPTQEVKAEDR